jgi:hypothetical protein
MEVAPTITFRRIKTPAALEADIHKRLAKLETLVPSIIGVHVLVDLADRHHRDGKRWRVRIEASVPGERIVVTHDASLRPELRARGVERARKQDEPDAGHKDAAVAVREAFEVARRQLQDWARKQRTSKVEATRRRPARSSRG